jgi:hypothetical protein
MQFKMDEQTEIKPVSEGAGEPAKPRRRSFGLLSGLTGN